MKIHTKFKLLSFMLVMTMLLTMAPFFGVAQASDVANSVDVYLSVTPGKEYRNGSVAYTVTAFNAEFVM